jgi:hypothetical protein
LRSVGHLDEYTRFYVSGWAANEDNVSDSVTIKITVNGHPYCSGKADIFRVGLESLFPNATGNYAFRTYFDPPLSLYVKNFVQVFVEGSDEPLTNGRFTIDAVPPPHVADVHSPANPLLISTSGRSGSTLLMSVLAKHPQIIVADKQPFEVEMLSYYAYALRALSAAGDHGASLRPDQITSVANRFSIGFNPFTSNEFRSNFQNVDLFDRFHNVYLPQRLATAFRAIVTDFYGHVAEDKNKWSPVYFAEKCLPEDEIRRAARFMFGRIKEIVLIRDLRDVVCSFMQHGKAGFRDVVDAQMSSAIQFQAIQAEGGDDVLFVKYEDLIGKPKATWSRIFLFLGLTPLSEPEMAAEALFHSHGTSATPLDSIGRWRRELSPEQLAACEKFSAFLLAFGYAGPDRPGAAADPAAQATPLARADLITQFESLGENCEFGLVQRQCGAEPLGLLRFTSAPLPKLLHALRTRFRGMGTPDNLLVELSANGREYLVHDRVFGFNYHAWVKQGEMPPDEIHAREVKRVPFLVRKLIEDLTLGEKIFVYHGMAPLTLTDAQALAQAVRAYGPGVTLWVELADAGHPPGHVEWVEAGLMKAYIQRFAPGEAAHDFVLEPWVELCERAVALKDSDHARARGPVVLGPSEPS